MQTYIINKTKLLIDNTIVEYENIISNRLLQFEMTNKIYNKYKYELHLHKKLTIIKIDEKIYKFNKTILKTDLFPLINNIIANIILGENDIYCHSVVLKYKNKGILILGDFGIGKSVICTKAKNKGFEIISTDQTWLTLNDKNELLLKKGSIYMRNRVGKNYYINSNNDCKITKIYCLMGVFKKAKIDCKLVEDKNHIIKRMFNYFTWHANIPLLSVNLELYINRKKILKWLKRINCQVYEIRGSSGKIVKKMKKELEK